MNEFESANIQIIESRILFDEVMVNFYQKNYRSCIVILNSLLYFDIIKKLELLKEEYDDKRASDILEKIFEKLKRNDKYSDVEKELLDLCSEKNIVNIFFIDKAIALRNIRNHCAHPAFQEGTLYLPTKSEVFMYIDFIFNNLLIISAVNYYNVTNYVLEDIEKVYEKGESIKSQLLRDRIFRLYKKFDKINRQKLFNNLFDLAIIKNTDDCKKYRSFTYLYLSCLNEYCKKINENLDVSIVKKLNIEHLDSQYGNRTKCVLRIIADGIVSLDNVKIFNNEIYDLYKEFLCDSEYMHKMYNKLFTTFDEFVEYLISDSTSYSKIMLILDKVDTSKEENHFYKLLKKAIELTPNYNGFDKSDKCIEAFVTNFSVLSNSNAKELLKLMNGNNQFFNSGKQKNKENKNKIAELFEVDSFDELLDSIELDEYLESEPFIDSFGDDFNN